MKRQTSSCADRPKQSAKKPRTSTKGKAKQTQEVIWPEYFHDLFKVFKALNTVLAFVSSRKHLATTFPVVRSSVEGLLKRPLDMAKVAELKALIPDVIKFAYIPRNELRIQSSQTQHDGRNSPDFSLSSQGPSSSQVTGMDEDEHVLVLEFAENSRGKKDRHGVGLSLPPAMSPNQTKKLIERRDDRFKCAVDELLRATPPEDDPVKLLQDAARDHIPVNPKARGVGSSQLGDSKTSDPMTIPSPDERPSVDEVITDIEGQEWYKNQIVNRRTFEPRVAKEGFLDEPLSEAIQQALRDSRNVNFLYIHQAAAINAISQKKHAIVSTSTASGKSVIYQVPLLRLLEEDRNATAIFVYPTKALAQDQRTALEQLLWSCPELRHIKVANYDGDTPQERRAEIRETASVIFTNFDMIHASILPHEEVWRPFLENLKLFAVDELHYYSSIFGSHVAHIIRRFRRVCAAVGNRRIVFVSCSATIAKPAQHMKRVFGIEDVEEITEDGAPCGRKDYLVWDPPFVDDQAPRLGRRSSISEATGMMRFLMKRGLRVILFCKIRKACELAMKTVRAELSAEGRLDILAKVMPYRGGYSQEDRRRIEHEAFSGNVLGLVATNALELGVDIGVLDAVIMLGFPFGLASFRQQAGRAGRRTRDSLAVLVADGHPTDQHYVNYPDELYNKPMDDLMIDLESKLMLEAHLQCAAHEMPLSEDDHVYFGSLFTEICDTKLSRDEEGWYHTHPKFLPYPARHVSIRGAEEEKYTLVDITKVGQRNEGPRILEEIELSRALFEVYEGGVFMHQGLTYIVKEVSHDTKMAKLLRADVNWITTPRDFTDVDAKQTYRIRAITNSLHTVFFGRVDAVTMIYGFYKIRNKRILDVVDVDTPPWERQGSGFWLDVPNNILALMRAKGVRPAGAIHSACHAWMNRFALATDLRTECKAAEKEFKLDETQRKRPARLIFYDSSAKSGVSAQGFDHAAEILRKAHDAVESCPCQLGCMNCIHGANCKEENKVSSKIGALIILRGLLNLEINPDSIPDATDEAAGYDTIVAAGYIRPVDGVEIESP